MQNIQDFKDRIFFESRNIITILHRINNVEELTSQHDLVEKLAERISFLKLLEKNIEYFGNENFKFSENTNKEFNKTSGISDDAETIFQPLPAGLTTLEEEEIFSSQLNEMVESDFHEAVVNFSEDEKIPMDEMMQRENVNGNENFSQNEDTEDHFNITEDSEPREEKDPVLSFVDEERILQNSRPESDEDNEENIFEENISSEETVYSRQLNEISNVSTSASFKEEKNGAGEEFSDKYSAEDKNLNEERTFITQDFSHQDEMITENSNVESILAEIKKDSEPHPEKNNENINRDWEDAEGRKAAETGKDRAASDESFEKHEEDHHEKRIRLSNIKGLKSIESWFEGDPLENSQETPEQKPEAPGSLLKTDVPAGYMEAGRQAPEFRLDLNDRIAFTKTLFNGSQSELNEAVSELNRCRNIEEAKEYLSDLYYIRKWDRVDEYAQRLWILVENKFL